MFNIGAPELILILLILLLLFGANRLPEIGKSLGRSLAEFKKAMREAGRDLKNEPEEDEKGT